MTTPPTPVDDAQEADPTPVDTPSDAPVADADTPTDPPADTTNEVEDAVKKATSKANREAQNLRKRLKELEDAEQARSDAALSETERLQKQLNEAQQTAQRAQEQAQAAALRAAIAVEAGKLNIVDADAALALVDRSTIEHTDDGVTGVAEALTALIEAKPYLVATSTPTPNLDQSNPGRTGVNTSPQQQTAALWKPSGATSIWDIPTRK